MENETINDKLDKILSAKNDVKAALIGAGYDVSGGFATYGAAASSLTSTVDEDITEINENVSAVSANVSSYSEAWKDAVDAHVYSAKKAIFLPKQLVPDSTDLSSWLVVEANTMKMRQQFSTGGYGNYTTYKYVVDGGCEYKVRTGYGGTSTGAGLFLYDENLSVHYGNTVSCLAYNPSGTGIFDFGFKTPSTEQKYVLGVFNNIGVLPSSEMVVAQYPDECPYNLTRIGKDVYAPFRLEPVQVTNKSWFSSTNGAKASQSSGSNTAYSALKYVVKGGKTYTIHTNMRSQLAIALFELNDQLSASGTNSISVLVYRAGSEPEKIYDLSVKIPDRITSCMLGVSHADNTSCRLSDVQVVDLYRAVSDPTELYGKLSAVEEQIVQLSAAVADAAVNDVIHVYEDRCRLDELIETTPSAWTNGTFDKGKLAFMLDDSRTDVGYIASFLSSEYGFPMGFAVQYNRIGGDLIQSYIEDNGDGTSSTYNCQFTTVSSLLVAEEAFGGETWAHDCSKGRWMLSVDGEGLVPRFSEKMAEYYFIEIRRALQSLGLKVNGFVSPYHDPLDCYLPQMSKYFKYARYSTRNYPNLPYQIPLYSIASSTFEQKKQWIDSAIANKKLILFYGHGVGGDSQISMKDLKQMFDYVKEKVDGGVLDVTTVKALYAAQQN